MVPRCRTATSDLRLRPSSGRATRDGLWTARQVPDRYAVTRDFVYAHANELGRIRLGTDPRPRLRLDPGTVPEGWAHVDEPLAGVGHRQRPVAERRRRLPPVDLIPFERDL